MRQFAVEYPDFPFVQVPLAQLEGDAILQARFAKYTVSADGMYVQVPLAQITWYHHISLFSKVKEVALRAFYITETARQGWSRDVMLLQIESDYHKMVDSLPNNFDATLPPVHSDLARDAFKDPYNLGFDISAVDDLLKTSVDNPTIGLLLCRSKSNTKVEYALRGMSQPLGVASYETKKILDDLKTSLMSIDDL